MSAHSLELERKHILERMQARRETYRRALANGEDIGQRVLEAHADDRTANPQTQQQVQHYRHAPVRDTYPRSSIMQAITAHPFLCALGVAAVVAIGPKRIARTIVTGTSTLTALTAHNQSNADMIGRLLTMAGAYVQGRSNRNPPG